MYVYIYIYIHTYIYIYIYIYIDREKARERQLASYSVGPAGIAGNTRLHLLWYCQMARKANLSNPMGAGSKGPLTTVWLFNPLRQLSTRVHY